MHPDKSHSDDVITVMMAVVMHMVHIVRVEKGITL